MKLRCDGKSPCWSCQKSNLECNNKLPVSSKRAELDECMELAILSTLINTLLTSI